MRECGECESVKMLGMQVLKPPIRNVKVARVFKVQNGIFALRFCIRRIFTSSHFLKPVAFYIIEQHFRAQGRVHRRSERVRCLPHRARVYFV